MSARPLERALVTQTVAGAVSNVTFEAPHVRYQMWDSGRVQIWLHDEHGTLTRSVILRRVETIDWGMA